MRGLWWGAVAIPAMVVLGGVAFSFMPPSPYFRFGVIALFLFWVGWLSPTRIIFGGQHPLYDAVLVTGFLLLGLEHLGVSRYAGTGLLAGMLVLAISSIALSYSLVVRKPSMLVLFRQQGRPGGLRPFIAFLLLTAFAVTLFLPLLQGASLLGTVPPLAAGFASVVLLLMLQRGGQVDLPLLSRMDGDIRRIGAAASGMFTRSATLLLGVSGLLILYFVVGAGTDLLRDAPELLAGSSYAELPLAALAIFGTTLLIALPVLMWRTAFLIRTTGSHEHLPDWDGLSVGAVLGCIVVAVLIGKGAPLLVWAAALTVFLICMGIARLGDYPRRVLMAGPFLAAIIYFGAYAYRQFNEVFADYSAGILSALGGGAYGTAAAMLVLFAMTVLFSVAGYLSFLYELWRD